MKALLVLEQGSVFEGISVGFEGNTSGEVVFNTAMTGYQEIMTDPSYAGQMVTFTSAHIGNVGINKQDFESNQVHLKGMIMRSCSAFTSHWQSQATLGEYLRSQKMVAIAGVDTRALTQTLRKSGVMQGCIMVGDADVEKAFAHIAAHKNSFAQDLTLTVSTKVSYIWNEGSNGIKKHPSICHVVVVDFGVKYSILRRLVDLGCKVTVVPQNISIDTLIALNPTGVLLSNGPGDPAKCLQAISLIQDLCEHHLPILGICLGMQLLAVAFGGKTEKLTFGHHGANHPVLDVETTKISITSQNHNYVVNESTLPPILKISHRSLFDGTVQGFKHRQEPIFAFQGHPEAGPGPHDAFSIFTPFIDAMKQHQVNQKADTLCQSV